MKSSVKGLGKSFRSNLTGQGAHPGNRKIVSNAPSQVSQLGSDSFAERQSKKRAPVRTGQGSI